METAHEKDGDMDLGDEEREEGADEGVGVDEENKTFLIFNLFFKGTALKSLVYSSLSPLLSSLSSFFPPSLLIFSAF